jgi:hypothetical protein
VPSSRFLAISGNIFGCHNWEVTIASSYRSEMLQNILQYTRQLPIIKNNPAQHANSADNEKSHSSVFSLLLWTLVSI